MNTFNEAKFANPSFLLATVTMVVCASVLQSQTIVYTLDADFDKGVLQGVNHDPPNNNQLQLNTVGTTFPIMWIANAGEDTVSKVDTNQVSATQPGCEIARYRTWFNQGITGAFGGPAPSRTAVDNTGNAFVANRHFDGRPASVLKILSEGGIDRNGNGVIDTSRDTNSDCIIQPTEIIPLVDVNSNGILEDNELADERVAWIEQVGPNNGLGRSLCLGQNSIWLGLFNAQQYYELNPDNGSIVAGPIATLNHNPYGCLIDGNGQLWSASLGGTLGQLNTTTKMWVATRPHPHTDYGIAIGANRVYQADQIAGPAYIQYDIPTNTFSLPGSGYQRSLGISVDGNGDVVRGQTLISKVNPATAAAIWNSPNALGSGNTRGVIPDSDNNIWAVNLDSHTVTKFRGSDGAFLGSMPVGNSPYTYSDATGISALTQTDPQGTWTVITDGGSPGRTWTSIDWNTEPQGNIPPGATITVEARAADTQAGLPLQPFVLVVKGSNPGLTGRFIQVRATLRPNDDGDSPVLSDLRVTAQQVQVSCDFNADGVVNNTDINAIFAARNTTVPPGNVAMDIDGNGTINVLDARQCVLRCTNLNCQ